MPGHDIVEAALSATTADDAETVQKMIAEAIGATHARPLGDKPNNGGLIKAAGGSYDHKIIENLTNMQDAVLERAAAARFGDLAAVPFDSPHAAAAGLFAGTDSRRVADLLTVTFRDSDPPARRTKRLTAVFRDQGCGMTAAQVPDTIFALGAEHKEGIAWLQGAFGLGGATTFRNAKAVVLVTRRAPELLGPHERDEIVVAVVEWKRHLKNDGAYYLVTGPWARAGDTALPYTVPSSAFPGFEPGTHLALISYGVEGYHRARHGDEKSFVTVADTRLFDSVLPIRFSDEVHEQADTRILSGLRRKLERNPRPDRKDGEKLLPFHSAGKTYQLPVRFWFFARKGEAGERKNSVASDHAVLLTSNGQVHKHWTPQEFKLRTSLTHLADRILAVVETDALPIEVRTSLFTADRSDTIRNEDAIRLEDAVAATIQGWDELVTLNDDLIREAIAGRGEGRPTRKVAEQISRALRYPGFAEGGRGSGGGPGPRPPRPPRPPKELYDDPTALEGPEQVTTETGKTKSVTFLVNAVDDFIPHRAQLSVSCDHPEITVAEIAVGTLRGGRVQVLIALPSGAELGVYRLRVELSGWLKLSGGLGPDLRWETKLEVVDRGRPRSRPPGGGRDQGKGGPGPGHQVALVWTTHENRDEWTAATVGEVEDARARDLAEQNPDYADLAALGDRKIPTLVLNEHYSPLKDYLGGRAWEAKQDRISVLKDHYAVGVGVGLLYLRQQDERNRNQGHEPLSEDAAGLARQALARGVLSMLPKFDELARSLYPDPPA